MSACAAFNCTEPPAFYMQWHESAFTGETGSRIGGDYCAKHAQDVRERCASSSLAHLLRDEPIVANEALASNASKWRLIIGIHDGTFMSREAGSFGDGYDSREAAVEAVEGARRHYQSLGYVLWFITLAHPNGKQESLGGNTDYHHREPFSLRRDRRDPDVWRKYP